ncbi:hypothetical protein PQR33_46175 [Paraburkholderia sediminicola]|uniref:hypothetical protein n=1 Tax=Paraburkholderia sediminicola TaxID=458836 RepID=UPI0038B8A393
MIVCFDETFEGAAFGEDEIAIDAIEAVCHSVKRGEHYLYGPRRIIKELAFSTVLSAASRAVFQHLQSQFSVVAGMLAQLQYRVTVSRHGGVIVRESDTRWTVPASHVARHGVRPTILLAENAHDGDLYIHAARHYRLSSGLRDVELKVEAKGGGGAGTTLEFRRTVERAAEWCLCITDSDQECPTGAAGATATSCGRIAAEAHSVARHVRTAGRELENVIPTQLLIEAAEKTHPVEVELYQSRMAGFDSGVSKYLDLKNGLALRRILNFSPEAPTHSYWMPLAEIARERSGFGADCLDARTCANSDDCQCKLFEGFGDKVAKKVGEFLGSESTHKSFERAKGSLNMNDWLIIGKEVFHAAAAPRPMRS